MKKYYYEYDDPYKNLAYCIIGDYSASEVLRFLTDDDFVQNQIIKENRVQDFKGAFIDCVIEDILDHKKRMEYMHKLDALSEYYFSNLDLPRLRKEIVQALKECGVDIQIEQD